MIPAWVSPSRSARSSPGRLPRTSSRFEVPPVKRRMISEKTETILPPVELPPVSAESVRLFGERWNPQRRHPVIGMATRLAAEKGVEVLLDALPAILERHPRALVLFAGQHRDVLGEQAYLERLEDALRSHQEAGRWVFVGVLSPEQMAAFYPNLDLLVVPSLNSTESFGLVQIEAMLNGVPVVASDLPGVRQPVAMTGMGRIAAIGDPDSLAKGMLEVLGDPAAFQGDVEAIGRRFAPDANAAAYEELYQRLLEGAFEG